MNNKCPNCGAALNGTHCDYCGAEAAIGGNIDEGTLVYHGENVRVYCGKVETDKSGELDFHRSATGDLVRRIMKPKRIFTLMEY